MKRLFTFVLMLLLIVGLGGEAALASCPPPVPPTGFPPGFPSTPPAGPGTVFPPPPSGSPGDQPLSIPPDVDLSKDIFYRVGICRKQCSLTFPGVSCNNFSSDTVLKGPLSNFRMEWYNLQSNGNISWRLKVNTGDPQLPVATIPGAGTNPGWGSMTYANPEGLYSLNILTAMEVAPFYSGMPGYKC